MASKLQKSKRAPKNLDARRMEINSDCDSNAPAVHLDRVKFKDSNYE